MSLPLLLKSPTPDHWLLDNLSVPWRTRSSESWTPTIFVASPRVLPHRHSGPLARRNYTLSHHCVCVGYSIGFKRHPLFLCQQAQLGLEASNQISPLLQSSRLPRRAE